MPKSLVQRSELRWLLALGIAAALLSLRFSDWPLNRDITSYATIAAELDHGARLYVDVWDLKPPGVFAAYLAARWAIPDQAAQIFLLRLIPTLIVLGALLLAAGAAGFGRAGAVVSGAFWVLLSVNPWLQTHEPNTEIFINACCATAFVLLLGLTGASGLRRPLGIGLLLAVATLFKTVALVVAIAMGLAYLVLPQAGEPVVPRARKLLVMAAMGAATLAGVAAYFAATGRFHELREVVIDAGRGYAGDIWANVRAALTLHPLVGDRPPFARAALALTPWLGLAGIAGWVDRPRRRSWLLLGAYGLGALVAVGMPGRFYRHYYQLLLPPICLGLGWLAATALPSRLPLVRRATLVLAAVAWLGLATHTARSYRTPVERAVAGSSQALYLQTQRMGRRLAGVLRPGETLYQWGEESGLYWYSGRRPPGSVLTYPLLTGPQADRLTRQSLASLAARPPHLVVAANYMLDYGQGHPVWEWVREHYVAAKPQDEAERRYFTLFVPKASGPELHARLGALPP